MPTINNTPHQDEWGDWGNAPDENISDSELLNKLDNSSLMDYDAPTESSEIREESSDYMLFRQLEEELLQDLDQ